MPIDKSKITKEILEKASHCKTADELIALAEAEGFEITKAEADAYLAELDDVELDEEYLDKGFTTFRNQQVVKETSEEKIGK